jgi:hypothetical protein
MTDPAPPKRPRGRPPKYAGQGKRQNFSFRITPALRQRLIESVKQSGRSLSEEIEHRLFRDLLDDIDQTRADTRRVLSSAYVQALRLAGFSLLRDVEGQPTRVIIDVGMLHAEADGILRSAFTAQEQAPRQQSRPMTAEEGERLAKEIEEIKATLKAVVEKTLAGDKSDEAA